MLRFLNLAAKTPSFAHSRVRGISGTVSFPYLSNKPCHHHHRLQQQQQRSRLHIPQRRSMGTFKGKQKKQKKYNSPQKNHGPRYRKESPVRLTKQQATEEGYGYFPYESRGNKKFIDRCFINIRSGNGGLGGFSYGGSGGNGGDVTFIGCPVSPIPRPGSFRAGNGQRSSKDSRRRGLAGRTMEIKIPIGTIIKNAKGEVLKDIDHQDATYIALKGGEGASEFSEEPYVPGKKKSMNVILELKSLADIGLVGFPNAGKSTLLSSMSNAKPKIASYPFTTINPEIGILDMGRSMVLRMADIPGLIEGASENLGMGFQFLKHIERTKILCYIVDINGFQLNAKDKYNGPVDCLSLLFRELEEYRSELHEYPSIVLWNKIDYLENPDLPQEVRDRFKKNLEEIRSMPERLETTLSKMNVLSTHEISADTGKGFKKLKEVLFDFTFKLEDRNFTEQTFNDGPHRETFDTLYQNEPQQGIKRGFDIYTIDAQELTSNNESTKDV